ncbi:hypothetical protein B0H15DRAFT_957080 [Mycena belliarum]|uniref:Uncharacterized protein n=1 Tax=Mycena belliarum TaxID=1033014 RepID=A0AAD6TPC0_9AGAR|nr:hypothetical protein B0H15DRAFT_957080 [Mycena belliae]
MARKKNGKAPGRASHFQGEKLEWLESFEDEFKNDERKTFYDRISKLFLARYGYDLAIADNVEGSVDEWVPRDRKEGLEGAELEEENMFQEKTLKAVRAKLSQWYRTHYMGKKVHGGTLNKILATMREMSGGSGRPRRKTAVGWYSNKYYDTRMKTEFDALWEDAKATLPAGARVSLCQDFVRGKWAEESVQFQAEIEAEAEAHFAEALRKYKEGRTTREYTSQVYHEALEQLNEVGIPLADALSEFLGMHIAILAVGPVGSQRGEVRLRSVFSDTARGQTTKMWGEFDRPGFTAAEASITRYGRAFFTRDECRARVWPPPEPELDEMLTMDDEGVQPILPATTQSAAPATTQNTTAMTPATTQSTTTTSTAPATTQNTTATTTQSTTATSAAPATTQNTTAMTPATTQSTTTTTAAPVTTTTMSAPPTNPLDAEEGVGEEAPVDDIDRYGWSETLINLHKLMSSKSWGGARWTKLTEALVQFEESMNFGIGGRLRQSQFRPPEYKEWMKWHRSGGDFPVDKNFGKALQEWWLDVGPKDRQAPRPTELPEGEVWPRREDPARAWVSWCSLRVAGDSGVLLVVLGLTWWGQSIVNEAAGEGLGAGEAALANNKEWQYMVEDVLWALGEMTDEMSPETKREWEQEKAEGMKKGQGSSSGETGGKKTTGKKAVSKKVAGAPGKASKKVMQKERVVEHADSLIRKHRGSHADDEAPPPKVQRRSVRANDEGDPETEKVPAPKPQARPRPRPKPRKIAGKSVETVEGSQTQEPPVAGPEVLAMVSEPAAAAAAVRTSSAAGDPFGQEGGDPFQGEAFTEMTEDERRDYEDEMRLDAGAEGEGEEDEEED